MRSREASSWVGLVVASMLALSSGCTVGATEVLVVVDTNVPESSLMTIAVLASSGSGEAGATHVWQRGGSALDSIHTPASFAINPSPEAARNGSVVLVVDAHVDPGPGGGSPFEFRRTLRFHFTPHTTTVVRVFLRAECGAETTGCLTATGAACTQSRRCEDQGMTCGDQAMCVPVDVNPAVLDGSLSLTPTDAAMDSPRDIVTDTPPDILTDAPPADVGCPGGCPSRPNATSMCVAGMCTLACASGFADCNGIASDGCEVSIRTDTANCGSCGMNCTAPANASATCTAGVCGFNCNAGFADCNHVASDGCEASLSSASTCGSCTTMCTVAAPLCSTSGGTSMCVSGCPGSQIRCGTSCVDTTSDPLNCMTCGMACTGGRVCSSSSCVCPTGQSVCSGICVNTQTDLMNCGACATRCVSSQTCVSGTCRCPAGQTLCGAACTDTSNDNVNCGACGHACTGGSSCTAGVCTCAAGQTLCGASCVNTNTDVSNCGSCGHGCATGQTCIAGTCSCSSGTTLCGSSCVDTQSDTSNCGACGATCPGGRACNAGGCAPPNAMCTTAIPLTSGGMTPGTTCHSTYTMANNCGGGPEVFYSFTNTSGTFRSFSVSVTAGSIGLSYNVSCPLYFSSCGGSSFSSAFNPGDTYYFAVTNAAGPCVDFVITANLL